MQTEFPNTVSYNRFVELIRSVLSPLMIYLKTPRSGKCSGISFVDSTPLRVFHNKRIHSNKVFADFAQRGKSSMGWFFGFKLHIIVNDKRRSLQLCFKRSQCWRPANSSKKSGANSLATEATFPKISLRCFLLTVCIWLQKLETIWTTRSWISMTKYCCVKEHWLKPLMMNWKTFTKSNIQDIDLLSIFSVTQSLD